MPEIRFKNGEVKKVSIATGESLRKSIWKDNFDRIVFSDSVSGIFTVKAGEVDSIHGLPAMK